jgi:CheY-like chemotaxis protein
MESKRFMLEDVNSRGQAVNLKLLKTYLSKKGYHNVESAENGLLAVQAVEGRIEGFDIIIMDLSMPEMDGFEATRLIRELESRRRSGRRRSPIGTSGDSAESAA